MAKIKISWDFLRWSPLEQPIDKQVITWNSCNERLCWENPAQAPKQHRKEWVGRLHVTEPVASPLLRGTGPVGACCLGKNPPESQPDGLGTDFPSLTKLPPCSQVRPGCTGPAGAALPTSAALSQGSELASNASGCPGTERHLRTRADRDLDPEDYRR